MPEITAGQAELHLDRASRCKGCEGSGKTVRPASAARPHLYSVAENCWFQLGMCQDCGRLWVQAPYEPYASYIYAIAWPYTREFWHFASHLQDGAVISKWSDYKIRQAWPNMSPQDREAVQNHRDRSYGRNPIDEAPAGDDLDPLEPFLLSAESQA